MQRLLRSFIRGQEPFRQVSGPERPYPRGIWLTLEAFRDDPVPLIILENVPRIATRGRHLLDQIATLEAAIKTILVREGNLNPYRRRERPLATHTLPIKTGCYMCISVRKNHSGTQRGTQSDTQFLPKVCMKIHPFYSYWGI